MRDVIQDFLVKLGFQVDDVGLKKFSNALVGTAKSAGAVGVAMVGFAAAVEAGVKKVADRYEDLYYMSQRSGSSVAGLQAAAYAGRQVGLAHGEAAAAIERFGLALRTEKGLREQINGFLGLSTAGTKTEDVFDAVVGKLSKFKDQAQAAFMAQQLLGVDDKTYFQLADNIDKVLAKQKELKAGYDEAGVGQEGLSNKSVAFSNALDKLEGKLGIIEDALADKFLKPLTLVTDELSKGLDLLLRWNKETNGWSTVGVAATSMFAGLGLGKSIITGLLAKLGIGGAAKAVETTVAETAGKVAAKGVLGRLFGLTGIGTFLSVMFDPTKANAGEDEWLSQHRGERGTAPTSRAADPASGTNFSAKTAMAYLQKLGWSRDNAAALVSQFRAESGMDASSSVIDTDNKTHYGLSQWSPERQKDFYNWAGHDIHQSTPWEQLRFATYELTQGAYKDVGTMIRGLHDASTESGILTKQWEVPAHADTAAAIRGLDAVALMDQYALGQPAAGANSSKMNSDNTVTVNQKVDLHIQSTDDKKTARTIREELGRPVADLAANYWMPVR